MPRLFPAQIDARLQACSFHNHNLGIRKAWRNRSSKQSLQDASFRSRAQRRAENHPATIGTVPAYKSRRSLSERPLLGHFALEEQTGQLGRNVPPSPQLTQLDLVQLRADMAHLKEMMQEFAGKIFSKRMADNTNNNNIDNNTTTNNNNNNDDNNDNDNKTNSQESSLPSLDQSKRCQESGLNSFDLDSENPESSFGSDLETLSFGKLCARG